MTAFDRHSGRRVRDRHARNHAINCSLEVLETRALMSAMSGHAAAAVAAAQAAVHANPHSLPTPIANFTGNPLTFSQVVGVPAVQTNGLPAVQDIATITSSTVPPKLAGYKVTVDWGDGATSRGVLIKGKDGLIHVKGSHRYGAEGTFTVTITVTQAKPRPAAGTDAPTLVIVSTANVTQNSAGGVTITPIAGVPFSGVVGNFTLPAGDTTTDPATFKAFIKWGDHSYSQGTVTLNDDGTYSVSGDHTYATAGSYRVKVFVVQVVPKLTAATVASASTESADFTGKVKANFRRVRFIAAIYSTANVGVVPPVAG